MVGFQVFVSFLLFVWVLGVVWALGSNNRTNEKKIHVIFTLGEMNA